MSSDIKKKALVADIEKQKKNEETTKLNLITPIVSQKWGNENVVMEYQFTDGQIFIDEFEITHRGEKKRADYLGYYKTENLPLAILEAKGEELSANDGYQQAIEYARILDVPFAYSTNGDTLLEFDRITGLNREIKMTDLPTMKELWQRYNKESGFNQESIDIMSAPFYESPTGKTPRYYQIIAVNRSIAAIMKGKDRVLLVMGTGTGKTFTAFQIIYKLFKYGKAKKILFLADRTALVDQTITGDFAPLLNSMCKIDNKNIDTGKSVFLGLYQQLINGENKYYKQLDKDFFDVIVVDECHRGSVKDDSQWREILNYFSSAVQIGLTATPKDDGLKEAYDEYESAKNDLAAAEKKRDGDMILAARKALSKAEEKKTRAENNSNVAYFGNPVYTYSLRQGIEDGFLAPAKVISVKLNIDQTGYYPPEGTVDANGVLVERKLYEQSQFDRTIIIEERRDKVAERLTDYLKTSGDRMQKAIVFCENVEHCGEMVRLLQNLNSDLVAQDSRYVMRITGNDEEGRKQLDNFTDPSSPYPVIAVTSELLTTGIDAPTTKLIVLDTSIGSQIKFKQIVGRGTRIKEKYYVNGEEKSKTFFTILDFRDNFERFKDSAFDGDPITVTVVEEDGEFPKPPIKPKQGSNTGTGTGDGRGRIIKVNNVEISIENEIVRYINEEGNLVTQNLNSCIKNNILTQYPKIEDFKAAWLLNNKKHKMAEELLLSIDWKENFKKQYGEFIDNYDIILKFGYDKEPEYTKRTRALSSSILDYLKGFTPEQKDIINLLLDAYIDNDFDDLRNAKNIFKHPSFSELGYTEIGAIRKMGGRDKYLAILDELENKLYE